MRSLDGLSLDQLGRWSEVAGFQGQDVDYRGGRAGSPPVMAPRCGDAPGSPAPQGAFIRILNGFREQDLGRSFQVRPRQPVSRGGEPPTATQGYLTRVPANFPVPPAWAIAVSPDQEQRMNSPATGTY